MAGHSKWNNIKRKKEATDAQRAKIFSKIGREIIVAIKQGGADPSANSKLKDLIAKAKANNFPNDNIERIIKKASGDDTKNDYESIIYEGYGPCGVAIIVDTLTDNRNRTAGDLRHYFDKFGGNLGQTGCVSYLFTRKGVLVFEASGRNGDTIMEDIIEAGGEDFEEQDSVYQVFSEPGEFSSVKQKLEDKGYTFLSAEIEYIPSNYISIENEEERTKMERLLEMLEDNDDVQNIWHNYEPA